MSEMASRVGLFAVALLACGVASGADSPLFALVGVVCALACCIASLRLEPLAGLAVGLLTAALVIVLKHVAGVWQDQNVLLLTVQVTGLLMLGWFAGQLGRELRAQTARLAEPVPGAVTAAYDSLGLLEAPQAHVRLEEEIDRARRTHVPLGLMIVRVEITDDRLDGATRLAVRRTVARLVEARLDSVDVPFGLSDHEIGAILPGATESQSWRLVAPLVDSVTTVTFADRSSGERRRVADVARVSTALVLLEHESGADDLLARARRTVAGHDGAAR